jgi:hypothetical protein
MDQGKGIPAGNLHDPHRPQPLRSRDPSHDLHHGFILCDPLPDLGGKTELQVLGLLRPPCGGGGTFDERTVNQGLQHRLSGQGRLEADSGKGLADGLRLKGGKVIEVEFRLNAAVPLGDHLVCLPEEHPHPRFPIVAEAVVELVLQLLEDGQEEGVNLPLLPRGEAHEVDLMGDRCVG